MIQKKECLSSVYATEVGDIRLLITHWTSDDVTEYYQGGAPYSVPIAYELDGKRHAFSDVDDEILKKQLKTSTFTETTPYGEVTLDFVNRNATILPNNGQPETLTLADDVFNNLCDLTGYIA